MLFGDQAGDEPGRPDFCLFKGLAEPFDTAIGPVKPDRMAFVSGYQVRCTGDCVHAIVKDHRDDGGRTLAGRPSDFAGGRSTQGTASFWASHQLAISAPWAIQTFLWLRISRNSPSRMLNRPGLATTLG